MKFMTLMTTILFIHLFILLVQENHYLMYLQSREIQNMEARRTFVDTISDRVTIAVKQFITDPISTLVENGSS